MFKLKRDDILKSTRLSPCSSACSISSVWWRYPCRAAAQSQGAIIGVVTDTSGAVLPGVTVIATGPALQVPQIESVTNERGEYRLSPLPPGVYTITFELSGFQNVKREDLGWRWGSRQPWIKPWVWARFRRR